MRIALFFDGKNFSSGWRDKTGSRPIDLHTLALWIVSQVGGSDSRFVGAHYYTGVETGPAAETEAQKNLATFLSKVELLPGFFVRRFERKAKRIRCRHCNTENVFTQEKEVDTSMVADMLRLAAVDAFDALVLISGDADLTPAVEGVESLGKQVYVASWGGSGLSKRIRKAAFDHIDLMEGIESAAFQASATPVTQNEAVTLEKNKKLGAPVTNDLHGSGEDAFLEALKQAEKHFSTAYVGLHYFVKNWKSPALTADTQIRSRLLETLIKKGLVEKYTADDQSQAIRIKATPT
jgi:uncharacterized LabA/DUF88 family protein